MINILRRIICENIKWFTGGAHMPTYLIIYGLLALVFFIIFTAITEKKRIALNIEGYRLSYFKIMLLAIFFPIVIVFLTVLVIVHICKGDFRTQIKDENEIKSQDNY